MVTHITTREAFVKIQAIRAINDEFKFISNFIVVINSGIGTINYEIVAIANVIDNAINEAIMKILALNIGNIDQEHADLEGIIKQLYDKVSEEQEKILIVISKIIDKSKDNVEKLWEFNGFIEKQILIYHPDSHIRICLQDVLCEINNLISEHDNSKGEVQGKGEMIQGNGHGEKE